MWGVITFISMWLAKDATPRCRGLDGYLLVDRLKKMKTNKGKEQS
jgi:hypothetical protein